MVVTAIAPLLLDQSGGQQPTSMPKISTFHGIAIFMYYNDHLPPHFHAKAGGMEILVDIASLTVLRGNLPNEQTKIVLRWAHQHQDALRQNWELARCHQPLLKI
jgi:hypothetical protein